MRPLYIPNTDHTIGYAGNKIYKPLELIPTSISQSEIESRLKEIGKNEMWEHLVSISHTINLAVNEYFTKIGSKFVLLPLTTRMISSPGALYGKERINYTTDTSPIKLKWFDLQKDVFLSESSQIYLELYLMMGGLDSVYAVYNSFRKEKSDATHLSEFHHIEYEGKVTQEKNIEIAIGLFGEIIGKLLRENYSDLSFFLFDDDINYLKKFTSNKKYTKLTFEQALDELYRATKDERYKEFTCKYFGAWEEVKITSLLDEMAVITEYPLYEIPFYHAGLKRNGKEVGENADIIWPYYREILGSGHRVRSLDELLEKAKIFNLPMEDYKYYLASREAKNYKQTSGFGLGYERFLQGLLKLPYIYLTTAFPRVHSTIYP